MFDAYGRPIDTIRVSITDQCNLHCFYCYTKKNIQNNHKFLSFDEIIYILKASIKLGIKRVKLTGGEPLLREGIAELIREIKTVEGVEDLSITTNGVLLKNLAKNLKKSGLDRINVSLDSLDKDTYHQITKSDLLNEVLAGLKIAKEIGFNKIKINTVLLNSNKHSINKIREYCSDNGFSFQLINQMNLALDKESFNNFEVTDRPPKCELCNRIRLTAYGELLPCLFSDISCKVDFNDIEKSIIDVINLKPSKGSKRGSKAMYEIGG